MDRREKQERFHRAIIDTLYPPPSHKQEEPEEDPITTTSVELDPSLIPDPENSVIPSSSSSEDDDEESGSQKLTRAQRKRIRKKKLKESNSSAPQRRKIIGPVLPSTTGEEDRLQGVRQNAAESQSQNTLPEECKAEKERKVKRRRMAKKVAKETVTTSHHVDNSDKDDASCAGKSERS